MRATDVQRPKKQRYRLLLVAYCLFTLGLVMLICTVNFLVDPLQYYRKAVWYKPILSEEERFQNPGLARNEDYDTIIIGTSMTENFVPSYVNQALGGKTLKLAMRGSTSREHYLIANLALNSGKVKRVIWGLDYFSLRSNEVGADNTFPSYLYDNRLWNKMSYLFNISTLEQSFNDMLYTAFGIGQSPSLDTLNNWGRTAHYDKERVIRHWNRVKKQELAEPKNDSLAAVQNNFTHNIMALIRSHPETEFIIYYPPYSILRQQLWFEVNPNRYQNQREIKKYIYHCLQGLRNVKLYDFQSDADLTYNLNNYLDITHHNEKINEHIIDSIAEDRPKYRVTSNNLDSLLKQLDDQVSTLLVDDQQQIVNVRTIVNGNPYTFTQPQWKEKGELLVPFSEIANQFHLNRSWDSATETAALKHGQTKIKFILNQQYATVNGTDLNMPFPQQMIKGKLYIPLRFTLEALGGQITLTKNDSSHERVLRIQFPA